MPQDDEVYHEPDLCMVRNCHNEALYCSLECAQADAVAVSPAAPGGVFTRDDMRDAYAQGAHDAATHDGPLTSETIPRSAEAFAARLAAPGSGGAETPNVDCPCGNPIIRDGVTVKSHWMGRVCEDCEAAMIMKFNARPKGGAA